MHEVKLLLEQRLGVEDGEYELFETCEDKDRGYCRILRCMSEVVLKHEQDLGTLIKAMEPECITH